MNMNNYWHDISKEIPDHEGWIWLITGQKKLGSKIISHYFKPEEEHMHGKKKLKEIIIGINYARYWMWQIPLEKETES